MGLDITAYRKLKKIDAVFDADGEPIDPDTREVLDDVYQPCVNHDFLGREEGLEHKAAYIYEELCGGISMGYSSYNAWRDELAKLAGYPAVPVDRYNTGNIQQRHDQGAWNSDGGPFWELINFSDCEGVIGPLVSAKLAGDFASFQEKADAHHDERFKRAYAQWRESFEMAADGGAVDFH